MQKKSFIKLKPGGRFERQGLDGRAENENVKYQTRVKVTDNDKRSSLSRY